MLSYFCVLDVESGREWVVCRRARMRMSGSPGWLHFHWRHARHTTRSHCAPRSSSKQLRAWRATSAGGAGAGARAGAGAPVNRCRAGAKCDCVGADNATGCVAVWRRSLAGGCPVLTGCAHEHQTMQRTRMPNELRFHSGCTLHTLH